MSGNKLSAISRAWRLGRRNRPLTSTSSLSSSTQIQSTSSTISDYKLNYLSQPLGKAIRCYDIDKVASLLDLGGDANGWSYVHRSISHLAHAASIGAHEILGLLLDRGAHGPGSGALFEAAEVGDIAAAEILIDRAGVDVNEITSLETYGDLNNDLKHFFESKLDGFIKESFLGTPLHAAAGTAMVKMVRYLLSRGADRNLRDDFGDTTAEAVQSAWRGPPDPEFLALRKYRMRILRMLNQ